MNKFLTLNEAQRHTVFEQTAIRRFSEDMDIAIHFNPRC